MSEPSVTAGSLILSDDSLTAATNSVVVLLSRIRDEFIRSDVLSSRERAPHMKMTAYDASLLTGKTKASLFKSLVKQTIGRAFLPLITVAQIDAETDCPKPQSGLISANEQVIIDVPDTLADKGRLQSIAAELKSALETNRAAHLVSPTHTRRVTAFFLTVSAAEPISEALSNKVSGFKAEAKESWPDMSWNLLERYNAATGGTFRRSFEKGSVQVESVPRPAPPVIAAIADDDEVSCTEKVTPSVTYRRLEEILTELEQSNTRREDKWNAKVDQEAKESQAAIDAKTLKHSEAHWQSGIPVGIIREALRSRVGSKLEDVDLLKALHSEAVAQSGWNSSNDAIAWPISVRLVKSENGKTVEDLAEQVRRIITNDSKATETSLSANSCGDAFN